MIRSTIRRGSTARVRSMAERSLSLSGGFRLRLTEWPEILHRTTKIDRDAYHALPEFVTVRETRVRVRQPGFRTRSIVVVTTLLDRVVSPSSTSDGWNMRGSESGRRLS